MKAIVEQGGRQYTVEEGIRLTVEKVEAPSGSTFTFRRVLSLGEGDGIKVGRPTLDGVTVEGVVERQVQGPKTIAYRYRKRKNYHRRTGHRQTLTRIRVTKIAQATGSDAAGASDASDSTGAATPA